MPEGKVAKIIDEYNIVVNIGANDGVSKDETYVVYSVGEEVRDPETEEVIDRIEHVKGRVEPSHIQEDMTVMESAETETKKSSLGMMMSGMAARTVQKKLDVEKDEHSESPEDEENEAIRRGDKIKKSLD